MEYKERFYIINRLTDKRAQETEEVFLTYIDKNGEEHYCPELYKEFGTFKEAAQHLSRIERYARKNRYQNVIRVEDKLTFEGNIFYYSYKIVAL